MEHSKGKSHKTIYQKERDIKMYKLAKEISKAYDEIKEEEFQENAKLTPQQRYRIFEELCKVTHQIYKQGREYVRKSRSKSV